MIFKPYQPKIPSCYWKIKWKCMGKFTIPHSAYSLEFIFLSGHGFCRTTDNCSFRIVHLLWFQFFTWIHTSLIGKEFSFLWQREFCSLLPLFQKYKQIPLTSELELTVETGDYIFKTCFPPQMVSCQQAEEIFFTTSSPPDFNFIQKYLSLGNFQVGPMLCHRGLGLRLFC